MSSMKFIWACVSLFLLLPELYVMSPTPREFHQLTRIVRTFNIYDFNYIEVRVKKNLYGLASLFDDENYKQYIMNTQKVQYKKPVELVNIGHFSPSKYNAKLQVVIGLLLCKYIEHGKSINRILLYMVCQYLDCVGNEMDGGICGMMLELIKAKNRLYVQYLKSVDVNVRYLCSFKDLYVFLSHFQGNVLNRAPEEIEDVIVYQDSLHKTFEALKNKLKFQGHVTKYLIREKSYRNEFNIMASDSQVQTEINEFNYVIFLAEMIDLEIEDVSKYDYSRYLKDDEDNVAGEDEDGNKNEVEDDEDDEVTE